MYFLGYETEIVTLENSERITLHINGTLEIRQISKYHEGFYQCIIENGVGSELKKDISIKVIG